jgi:hypothetical protein
MALSYGKYADLVASGKVFIGSTPAAGVALPLSTGTAITLALWNTSASKWAIPLWVAFGFTSGTIALGQFGLATQNAGYALATAAPLSAFTTATPINAFLGAGNASAMSFANATATATAGAAATAVAWLGKSIESATPGLGIYDGRIDLDGSIIVRPGQVLYPVGSVAQTGLFSITMAWAETDPYV